MLTFHGNVVFVAKHLKIRMFVKKLVQDVERGAPLAAHFDEDILA